MLERTIEERLGVDLADGYCGAPVHALGLVGIAEGGLADAVFRLKYANDSKSYDAALEAVSSIVKDLDTRRHWRMKAHSMQHYDVAQAVLDFWLCDVCPSCTGKGRQKLLDAPVLGEACLDCRGTGKRQYPWAGEQQERWYVITLSVLQCAERRVRDALLSKLATQIREADVLTRLDSSVA